MSIGKLCSKHESNVNLVRWMHPTQLEVLGPYHTWRHYILFASPSVCSCWSTLWRFREKQTVSHLKFSSNVVQLFLLMGLSMAVEGFIDPVVWDQSPPRRKKLYRSAATSTFQRDRFFKVCNFPPIEIRLG